MIADGLIKALPRQWHEAFVSQIRLDDIATRIQQEKRMKVLRDKIKDAKAPQPEEMVFFIQGDSTVWGIVENGLYI